MSPEVRSEIESNQRKIEQKQQKQWRFIYNTINVKEHTGEWLI